MSYSFATLLWHSKSPKRTKTFILREYVGYLLYLESRNASGRHVAAPAAGGSKGLWGFRPIAKWLCLTSFRGRHSMHDWKTHVQNWTYAASSRMCTVQVPISRKGAWQLDSGQFTYLVRASPTGFFARTCSANWMWTAMVSKAPKSWGPPPQASTACFVAFAKRRMQTRPKFIDIRFHSLFLPAWAWARQGMEIQVKTAYSFAPTAALPERSRWSVGSAYWLVCCLVCLVKNLSLPIFGCRSCRWR